MSVGRQVLVYHDHPAPLKQPNQNEENRAVNEVEFDVKDAGRTGYKNKCREKESRQGQKGENNRKAKIFLKKLDEKRLNRRAKHFQFEDEE